MNKLKIALSIASLLIFVMISCGVTDTSTPATNPNNYKGTGSITQGLATTTTANLFPAGMRIAALGTITSTDGKTWNLPADVNFTSTTFPTASDLYNNYVPGHAYSNASQALAALNSTGDIITIDANGEVYTAYIFADNYFEIYVNGVSVGKDPIPFTEFNSNIIRFRVSKPFTIAVKCVDWEESLGIGTENNNGNNYHAGDGRFVAVFKDASNTTTAITNNTWKAQTFYTAPISDLSCLNETGTSRLSVNCSTTNASATSYGVHWAIPSDWFSKSFDDSAWPAASTYTNSTVGVDNKPSYTNFTDIFDNSSNDASFIWSTNLVLDNVVLLRKTID